MKKIALIIACLLLLCGCAAKETKPDVSFLTNADWTGSGQNCENSITFYEDYGFSNSCACGSPVGDGDIIDYFEYKADEKEIDLFCDGEVLETAKILFADDMYLVIDIWDDTYIYENKDYKYFEEINETAKEETGLGSVTLPCLSLLEYENDILTVSSYDYDGDTASEFEKWKLEAVEDIIIKSVEVKIENGKESITSETVSKADFIENQEFFGSGYFEFDSEGRVTKITFYGETIIEY